VRHGPAGQHGATPGPDHERPLTRKGVRRTRRAFAGLRRAGVRLDAVYSSPYRRARETAELLVRELRFTGDVVETPALVPDAVPGKVLEALRSGPDGGRVALVGHEPHLSHLLGVLIGGNAAALEMGKAGVACVLVTDWKRNPPGLLRWLATPRLLRRLA
jgi:phosphohistidine phosphatase